MIRPRITETIGALGRAVKSAGLEFDGVDRILLVGGSSRIPLVAEMVREATGRPIAVDAASQALDGPRGGDRGRSPSASRRRMRHRRGRAGAIAAATGLAAAAGVASGHDPWCRRSCRRSRVGAGVAGGPPVAGAAASGPSGASAAVAPPPGGPSTTEPAAAGASSSGMTPRHRAARSRIARRSVTTDDHRDRCRAGRDPCRCPRRRCLRDALGGGASQSPAASVAVVSTAPSVAPSVARRSPRRSRRASHRPRSRRPRPPRRRRPTPAGRQARINGITLSGEHVRRPLAGLRLQAGAARPARPLLLRHGPADRSRDPRRRGPGPSTPDRTRSRATRSATGRPARPRCASSSPTPTTRSNQNTGNCVDLP